MRTPVRIAGAGGVLLAAALLVVAADPFGGAGESRASEDDRGAAPRATATVERGPLAARIYENGTLVRAGRADGTPYTVVNQAAGLFTALPAAGARVACGEVLYRVGNEPVVLLCGGTPAYRPLAPGARGPDVEQLNRNLRDLGYASRSELDRDSRHYGAETAEAVARLQEDVGLEATGELALGQVVFLPGPLRLTRVTATEGTPARPGAPVAQATSTRRRVEAELSTAQATGVEVGDRARITLPDNTTTPGVVTRVGTVAAAEEEDGGAGGAGATAPASTLGVTIRPRRPEDVRGLDEAPVRVEITTEGVEDALSVPVTALVAQAGGGYAVETVGAGGARRLVPVELGMFDAAGGVVQVTGDGLAAGQRVVVPAT